MDTKELSPSEYFDIVKEKKNIITDIELQQIYDNCLILLNKYKITGQTKAMKKLIFHLETIEKEIEIVRLGINSFVYKDDIEEFIDTVSKNTVKIIDLESYEREIPDDIVAVLELVSDKFDKFYIVFTDYTGKVERQVEKERREKDPILFGTFQDKSSQTVIDRFYYIGDWEDEFCDLTLDKLVNEVKKVKNKDILLNINTPTDIAELKEQLAQLDSRENSFRMNNNIKKKKTIYSKIHTFLMGRL